MLTTSKADQAATVVPFRLRPSRERRDEQEGDGGIGQILLFTGVRYERMDDTDAAIPMAARVATDRRPEAEC